VGSGRVERGGGVGGSDVCEGDGALRVAAGNGPGNGRGSGVQGGPGDQVALHGLEVGLEAQGAGDDAGDGRQPPHPHGPQLAARHHTPPPIRRRQQHARHGRRSDVVQRAVAAAAPAAGGGGVRAELGEVIGADGGGDPVEGAGEEVGGEGAGEVVPGDALEGCDSVTAVGGGDGGAEGEEDVDEEEGVAGEVGGADL
jgi:hypothetical protein